MCIVINFDHNLGAATAAAISAIQYEWLRALATSKNLFKFFIVILMWPSKGLLLTVLEDDARNFKTANSNFVHFSEMIQ